MKTEKDLILKEFNKKCYFCNFNISIHKHHLIKKSDFGDNKEKNLIGLCPNHHAMLHNGFILQFSNGFYIMRKLNEKDKFKLISKNEFMIPPTKEQLYHKREFPEEQLFKAVSKNKLTTDDEELQILSKINLIENK